MVSSDFNGKRLDQYVADLDQFSHLTRTRVQSLIRSGNILVDDQLKKTGYRLKSGESVRILLPPAEPSVLIPEKLSIPVLLEDEDIIVLSKPPGLVVHPSHGHDHGTLVHGLLYQCRNLSGIGGEQRPGIVHRLDKDTSGIMIVAKNDQAHQSLVDQFKSRNVEKYYLAILDGIPREKRGKVDAPIGRHPVHRKKMSILQQGGRHALTHWEILEEFQRFCLVKLKLETGRTHQIRVHMSSLGCPVAGDIMYGRKKNKLPGFSISRQCLHSLSLSFNHPRTGERFTLTAPLWDDMEDLLHYLRNENSTSF
ncbi:MAG: RluA family pseudouridine synthase [Desulfobulbaceae bacterium]|nr:RluA family pseudouridine synthase [Desulfobulbaceae bacterium]